MYTTDDRFENESLDFEESIECPFGCPYCQMTNFGARTPFPQMPQMPPNPNQMQPNAPHTGSGPNTPPPSFTPKKAAGNSPNLKSVSPGSIKPCVYQYVYIWLDNGDSFWAWLTRVDRRTAAGWKWTGRR